MGLGYSKVEPDRSSEVGMAAGIPGASARRDYPMLRRFSGVILELALSRCWMSALPAKTEIPK